MQVLFGILGTIETKKQGLIVHGYKLVNFLSQDVWSTIAIVMDRVVLPHKFHVMDGLHYLF